MEDPHEIKKPKNKTSSLHYRSPLRALYGYLCVCVCVCAGDSVRCEDNQHPIILMIACLHFIQICVCTWESRQDRHS